jgi:ribose transport system permease protein
MKKRGSSYHPSSFILHPFEPTFTERKGKTMFRQLGVFLLVVLLFAALMASNPHASDPDNLRQVANQLGFWLILTFGAGILIISGGIDLSIGSVVALNSVAFGVLMEQGWPPLPTACFLVAGSLGIGLIHGLLVTRLGLQPFLVTLCGLFVYRGLARVISASGVGLGTVREANEGNTFFAQQLDFLLYLARGDLFGVPLILFFSLGVAAVLSLLLHGTTHGRYLFAIGANEQAARYAGIHTDRYKVFAYVLCSGLAGLGGVVELLQVNTASPPTAGTLYELYAITGAVLGGCSLRGGEGSGLGILLGTAVLPLIKNWIQFVTVNWQIPDSVEYVIIGLTLLTCTIMDEVFKRRAARRG